ncbi:MAG: ankyrin repeat domain-containing protein [Dechloromonas sp.]|nr:MAG: ankyrin repeat domain-containing protein [Dechloromonas sp.]
MSGKYFAPSKLVSAIRAGRLSGVIAAIDDGGDIEETDIHGFSGLPLRTACFAGEMSIVRELLRCGADVNAMAADGPGAPLRLALRGGHPDIAALLVQHGADIPSGLDLTAEVTDKVGRLPAIEGEATAPLLPESMTGKTDETIDSIGEATEPYAGHLIEEVDVNACYGTDTNLLTMDILRDEENTREAGEAQALPVAKPGFWKTSRS